MGAGRLTAVFIFACLFFFCLLPAPILAASDADMPPSQTEGVVPVFGNDGNDESLWYAKENPMKKEYQKLLWDYCITRNLNYVDMLALIYVESNFNEKCSTGSYKGYFQISSGHGPNLSKALNTSNKPLDGAVNINWGTAMYGWILADERVVGLTGSAKRDAALSIYQRGTGGYDRYGLNKSYLKKYYEKRAIVLSWFERAN